MSFWMRLREVLGGGDDSVSVAWYVIDTAGFFGNGGRTSPRERVALLNKLAQFAEREKLQVCALLEGRPLREAPDGETFKNVTVHYAESGDQVSERVKQLAKELRSVMIVTQRRELEDWAREKGFATLRTSSLRRGFDENGGSRGGDSGRSRGGRGRRSSGRQRRSSDKGQNRQKNSDRESKPQKQNTPDKKGSNDGVSDLIDLV